MVLDIVTLNEWCQKLYICSLLKRFLREELQIFAQSLEQYETVEYLLKNGGNWKITFFASNLLSPIAWQKNADSE